MQAHTNVFFRIGTSTRRREKRRLPSAFGTPKRPTIWTRKGITNFLEQDPSTVFLVIPLLRLMQLSSTQSKLELVGSFGRMRS